MTTVLVPVGHEIEASRAVSRVVGLVDRGVDRVVVLHVHESVRDAVGSARVQPEPGLDCIAAIVARTLRGAGISADWRSVRAEVGELATAIAGVASDVDADVVVVGDVPTWLSTHHGVREQLETLLPGTQVVPVRNPC
ncbi:hypothetical protein acdb102_24030 [Acidothermaceae bacterium B102]|nr:hypothetical protein acdb102_24030 [Acidothermaceae bacterium B102]